MRELQHPAGGGGGGGGIGGQVVSNGRLAQAAALRTENKVVCLFERPTEIQKDCREKT